MTVALQTGGFDWIVVGAGSGGAAVARRLAERGSGTVLLLEAGPPDTDYSAVADPSAWVSLMGGPLDWGMAYAPAPHALNRVIPIPRGRVVGGCSATNALLWYRGHPSDYDGWGEGWRFADVLPVYRRIETWQGGADAWRGGDGPMHVSRAPDPHPVALALIEGARALGLPVTDDPNGASNEGAALANLNIHRGRRWSVADGYVRPMLGRPGFTLRTGATVTGLTFEGTRCTGVRLGTETIRAAQGVVLAAGALLTPKLLMLSGIGPADALRSLGIGVRADLPVGDNLQDHPLLMGVNFRATAPLGPVRDNGGGAMLNWKSRPGLSRPDLHAFVVQGPHAGPMVREGADLSGPVYAVSPGLMDSRSRGWLRLTGPGWDDPMEIQPNYLAEPADLEALVASLDTVAALAGTEPFRAIGAQPVLPARRLTRAEKIDFVRRAVDTFFHPCGTAAIGRVVDARLAVMGVEGLTVADASVFPDIPTCNTNAPAIMVGERAADFLTGHA
jgi:choline dehydrogenase